MHHLDLKVSKEKFYCLTKTTTKHESFLFHKFFNYVTYWSNIFIILWNKLLNKIYVINVRNSKRLDASNNETTMNHKNQRNYENLEYGNM